MQIIGQRSRLLLMAVLVAILPLLVIACESSGPDDSDTVTEFCNLSLVVCDSNRANCLDNSPLASDDRQCNEKFRSCLFTMCQSVNLNP